MIVRKLCACWAKLTLVRIILTCSVMTDDGSLTVNKFAGATGSGPLFFRLNII
jgi:hypothetical protein